MRKKIKNFVALFLAVTLMVIIPINVNAASTTSRTITSSKAMSIALQPGETGDSNEITFNFNSLPANAVVTEIKVDASNARNIGGMGAILAQSITITNPDGETKTATWGRGNVTKTTAFINDGARGTWSVYMTGRNIASPSSGPRFIGGVKYSSVKMTISYVLE